MLGGAASVIPYTLNPATLPDGALPAPLTGATWAISSGVIVNTPTEGAELLTDGGCENWTTANNLTSWTETIQAGGTSTVNQEGTVKRSGSYSARLDIDAAGKFVDLAQVPTLALGDWAIMRSYLRANGDNKTIGLRAENQLPGTITESPPNGSFGLKIFSFVKKTAAGFAVSHRTVGSANTSFYIDDMSVKKQTTSTLMATMNAAASLVTVKGAWSIVSGSLAGVVINLDSAASPLNFIFAVHNGQTAITLIKCVNGTYTSVLSNAATTYVANANVEIRHTATTTYQLWYNGAQIGTDQTIDEPTIYNNTLCGTFSTWGGNSLNRFFVG